MQIFVALAIVALVLAILAVSARSLRGPKAERSRPPIHEERPDRVVVTLDLSEVATGTEAARRIVDEAARQAFAEFPEAMTVVVRDRDGVAMGERHRERPREVAIPDALYEPHARRRTGPDPMAGTGRTEAHPGARRPTEPDAVPVRALADRFDLPDDVRDRVADPDDAVDLVEALLSARGRAVAADADLLRAGDQVVVVIRAPIGEPVSKEAMNHAFRRFRDSGAARGIVITPGFMDPRDVRRRELFAPALLHAGPEGIQRMADAVALGADPLRFAAAPPLVAARG